MTKHITALFRLEGVRDKIKLIKRMSYGFRNFRNYALKITAAFQPRLSEQFSN